MLATAQVQVTNAATGHRSTIVARDGRFTIVGLEPGDGYSIIVRRLGYDAFVRDSIALALGERLQVHVTLTRRAERMDAVSIVGTEADVSSVARPGIGARLGEPALRTLPTLNRDVYDFVQLTPEVSVRSGLLSAAGMSPRYNNFLIDGVSQRHLQGSLPVGGFSGGKSLSIEAVRDYEVILSAFDVRYGDFAGAMVNAVTRRGTNKHTGSVFAYGRNEQLARNSSFLRASPYDRAQYGFTVGGPLVVDRLHFFLASEFQRLSAPASGPYVGQEASGAPPAPVSAADVDRFRTILSRYGIDAGSGGRVTNSAPLANVFGRVDIVVPAVATRAVLWHNFSHLSADRFDRSAPNTFPLASVAWNQQIDARVTALQLFTTGSSGAVNELVMAITDNPQRSVPEVRHPFISVTVLGSGPTSSPISLQAGTRDVAQGGGAQEQSSLEVADHYSFSAGVHHRLGLGGRVEVFSLRGPGTIGSYGRWEFADLESLETGDARSYTIARGPGGETLRASQYAAYVSDEWRPGDRLEIMLGIRVDAMFLQSRPPYHGTIDAIYGRRTDAMPHARPVLSPRAGFSWMPSARASSRLRGGIGVFAVRPPVAWLHAAMYNHGESGTLTCGPSTSNPQPPPFEPDYRLPPQTCANGAGFGTGPVHLLDPHLKLFAGNLRASMAYDRDLLWGIKGTLEGLYSRSLSDFIFVNMNLVGPQSVDRFGRVLYGSIASSGIATPVSVPGRAPEIIDIDVRNHSRNHAYQLAGRLAKPGARLTFAAGYAFSRIRDVQSLGAGFPPSNNWRAGVVPGAHESRTTGVSAFEVQHRIVLSATARAPWRPRTDASLYYVGESGMPFTYIATGAQGRGDLNADGSNTNDPIYVPRAATDTNEMRFNGSSPAAIAEQREAFDRFINSSACLRRQRGRIAERNGCRAPWVNTANGAIRHTVFTRGGQVVVMQLEVFNVLNLLHDRWGLYRQPTIAVLQHVPDATQPQPVFRFDATTRRHTTENLESGYQLQLAIRYCF